MRTSAKLQPLYNELYSNMRKYIWDYDTVATLVDVESETYRRFPNMDQLRRFTSNLKSRIIGTSAYKDDDAFRQSLETFEESINDEDDLYAGIAVFKEVICNENK